LTKFSVLLIIFSVHNNFGKRYHMECGGQTFLVLITSV